MCSRLQLTDDAGTIAGHYEFIPTARAGGEVISAQWGLSHSWEGSSAIPVCTVDSRLASTRPRFRSAFLRQRCLIPVTRFFTGDEWFTHPVGLMLAGLWDRREGLDSFAVITTQGPYPLQRIREYPLIVWPEDEALYFAEEFDGGLFAELAWRAHTHAEAKTVAQLGHL